MSSIPVHQEDAAGSHVSCSAPRIGDAREAEKRMQKWSEGMELHFISWNVAAMHTFDFSFCDAWSRKKIKALPSRKPGVSSDVWSNVYTTADDLSPLKWPGEVRVVLLEVPKELRGGIDIMVDELATHGDESVEFLVNDELFYHAGDLTVPARPAAGMDMLQGPRKLDRDQTLMTMIRWIRMTTLWRERKTSQVD